MGLLHTALDLVLPRTCPGCHAPEPWCANCAATLAGRPRAIALPESALDLFADLDLPELPAVHGLSRYAGPVRAAVLAGKERGRRDLPGRLGVALGRGIARLQDLSLLPGDVWLVPAPSRRSASRARGGDPVLTMARSAAATLAGSGRSTGVAPCLSVSDKVVDSVGLDAPARVANLAGRIRLVSAGRPPPGASIVLLDDVLTSGATVAASLRALADRQIDVTAVLVLASVPPFRAAH